MYLGKWEPGSCCKLLPVLGLRQKGECSLGLPSDGALGFSHAPSLPLGRLFIVGRSLHIANQPLLLAQLLETSNHLLHRFTGSHLHFQHSVYSLKPFLLSANTAGTRIYAHYRVRNRKINTAGAGFQPQKFRGRPLTVLRWFARLDTGRIGPIRRVAAVCGGKFRPVAARGLKTGPECATILALLGGVFFVGEVSSDAESQEGASHSGGRDPAGSERCP